MEKEQCLSGLAGACVLINSVNSASTCLASSFLSSIPTDGPNSKMIHLSKLHKDGSLKHRQQYLPTLPDMGCAQHSSLRRGRKH